MSYTFHNIKKIVQVYLEDLSAHSKKRDKHPSHLRAIFDICRKYKIHINPHQCIFCVISRRLLGLIVSKYRLMVGPLKVEAFVQLPPPSTVHQLQSLQGKSNFLRQFVSNYPEITKGFMRLLKKDVPFYWDDQVQWSFEALKKDLTTTPLLSLPNFSRYFILYLESFDSTTGMVLV